MTFQISVFAVLKNQIQISGGLFGIDELDDVFVLDDGKDVDFEVNSFELFGFDIFKGDFFDGV